MVGIKGKTISWLANDSAFYGEVFFWNQIFVVDIQKGMGKTVPLKTNFYFFFFVTKGTRCNRDLQLYHYGGEYVDKKMC